MAAVRALGQVPEPGNADPASAFGGFHLDQALQGRAVNAIEPGEPLCQIIQLREAVLPILQDRRQFLEVIVVVDLQVEAVAFLQVQLVHSIQQLPGLGRKAQSGIGVAFRVLFGEVDAKYFLTQFRFPPFQLAEGLTAPSFPGCFLCPESAPGPQGLPWGCPNRAYSRPASPAPEPG